jgi:hypothetical protein
LAFRMGKTACGVAESVGFIVRVLFAQLLQLFCHKRGRVNIKNFGNLTFLPSFFRKLLRASA